MKAWMRRLVIACAVACVVLAVLAASASADRPIRQTRPSYVEWGDPDSPAGCREHPPVTPVVLGGSELCRQPSVSQAALKREVERRIVVSNAPAIRVAPKRFQIGISGLGIRVRK